MSRHPNLPTPESDPPPEREMYSSNTWPLIILIGTTVLLTAIIVADRVRKKRAGKPSREMVGYSQFQYRGEQEDIASEEEPRSDMAHISMIMGIVGIFLVPAILGILALTYGIIAKREIERGTDRTHSMGKAIAGIVLGIFDIIVGIAAIIILIKVL